MGKLKISIYPAAAQHTYQHTAMQFVSTKFLMSAAESAGPSGHGVSLRLPPPAIYHAFSFALPILLSITLLSMGIVSEVYFDKLLESARSLLQQIESSNLAALLQDHSQLDDNIDELRHYADISQTGFKVRWYC